MHGIHLNLKPTTKRTILVSVLLLVILALNTSRVPGTLDEIKQRGVLRMATAPGSTAYYMDAKGHNGLEYLLVKAFADSIGVEIEVSVMNNLSGLLLALGGPRGDLAAAGLVITPERLKKYRFSDPYAETSQQLIYRIGNKPPRNLNDLDGRLLALANSSHTEQLRNLKQDHPNLEWEEYIAADLLEVMQKVHDGEVEYAIVDDTSYLMNRNLYPKSRAAFNISEPQPLAWAFPSGNDDSLINAVNKFIKDYKKSGELDRLIEQFLGHSDKFSVAGSQLFIKRIRSRLPTYEPIFKEAANKYDMDWHLVAAIAYQESHWNPKATSPTGVRGLMMLTRDTAKEMGVKDRLNPHQSTDGGVRYFLKTKGRIPDDITEPDRTWFALASYNVGLGHLEDARVLTQRGGKNPDLWEDVRKFLPKLQQKKYYDTVKYGYARGNEPVQYVQNIRYYHNILETHTREEERKTKQPDFPSSSNLDNNSLRSL